KPRDTIIELRKLDSTKEDPLYEKRSDKMAELVRDYYESLQSEGLATSTERQAAIENVLGIIQTQLSLENKEELEKNLSSDNISEVINILPNGKAPGTDGLPYEFWK
ncbi:hypothetical protein EV702DRAFT_956115, partial [Suillus placidus]